MSIAEYVKRSGLSMGEVADLRNELAAERARADRLAEALEPFAEAGRRCLHFGNPSGAKKLFAIEGNGSWELLAVWRGAPVFDKPLTVQHLFDAQAALAHPAPASAPAAADDAVRVAERAVIDRTISWANGSGVTPARAVRAAANELLRVRAHAAIAAQPEADHGR